jgi:hypothetical protein
MVTVIIFEGFILAAARRMSEKVSVPANPGDERGAKRRLRSIKRESRPARQGAPVRAAQGQRKASRGTRLRQRRT